ncbi:sulfite exporter TauE/SafE family protein [Algoriphagus sp.]|uniref:sulfite exporter TauE/SafE family protein n=1 Tax=Algoriphagus sp. TaxID=1872435 RepID=UPI00271E1851|nr:sulfite exporter TauE/SafE family protein [Algoriphagus sp.]MDO8967551.1 sulfite exporter TauE/SafE family protein [Algoriphagus sp.]MDP3199022.1 sulfite exporter TauE/SafE family protein [Algoriphagus sp.]
MDILIISLAAFLTAILTFFSGFGLGTILTPVFVIFFPIDLAIALTGVVHFFNNIFKLFLVGRDADKSILIRFGIPAIFAAFFGAWILLQITDLQPLFSYQLFNTAFEVTPIKLIISLLLILFALMDLIPLFERIRIEKRHMPFGGILSGFFGGLSGHQGALRAAFLIKAGLTKEAFIGTSVVIGTLIDFSRLAVYSTRFLESGLIDNLPLVAIATFSAILGAFLGNKLLKKVTLKFLQQFIAILLILISIALGAGWI